MDWRDEGIVLSVRAHGESSAIVDVFTGDNGRQSGLVRGGSGKTMSPVLQPGSQVAVEWRGRLEEHLGNFRIEPVRARAAEIMTDRAALAGFNAMASLILAFLPDRAPDRPLYDATIEVADELAEKRPDWPGSYARWELLLLNQLGFGLDLDRCAATGTRQDLAYVSPRTGRVVSRDAGGPWADKLLPLAPFLLGGGSINAGAVRQALRMTGWFLLHRVCREMGRESLPDARERLMELFDRHRIPADLPRDTARDDRWAGRLGLPRQQRNAPETLKL